MAFIVLGGAGFLGSTIVDRLLAERQRVVIVDDMSTGNLANIGGAIRSTRASFVYADVSRGQSGVIRDIFELTADGDRRVIAAGPPLIACTSLGRTIGSPLVVGLEDGSDRDAAPCVLFDANESYGPRMRLDSGSKISVLIAAALDGARFPCVVGEDEVLHVRYAPDLAAAVVAAARAVRGTPQQAPAQPVALTAREIWDALTPVAAPGGSAVRASFQATARALRHVAPYGAPVPV